MFNEAKFVERAKTGEIREQVIHSGEPSAEIGLPPGTKTQMISYLDSTGFELARAHRFLLPDGTIGASGKPDPKRMFKDGKLFRIQKSI
jgi:hypothetical protein